MRDAMSLLIRRQMPRILTQLCRDPDSKNYGCWDRNFWHYKIRDYSSIILQQGSYLLLEAARLDEYQDRAEYLRRLAQAGVDFWHTRALKYGAFEEYYPFERSYPGLAFSTLAIAKIIRDLPLDHHEYTAGLRKAIKQLELRTEFEASNQYLAGLAALYVISDFAPSMVDVARLDRRFKELLNTQSSEGWFNEYGGPDLGYLSVSIDCLWDIWDVTGADIVLQSIRIAIGFIDALLIAPRSIGLHSSRQTDYIVPYGIIRMAGRIGDLGQPAAQRISELLFSDINEPEHFFQAIDDRYWVHYIGHSVVRAYAWGGKLPLATENEVGFDTSSPPQTLATLRFGDPRLCRKRRDDASTLKRQDDASTIRHYPEAGYIVIRKAQYSGLISTRKGGMVSICGKEDQYAADYGSDLHLGKRVYVMNWWGSSQLVQFEDNRVTIKGSFVPTKEHISTPFKHLLLRLASYALGASIISTLKTLLIFSRKQSPYTFTREISIGEREIKIVDATSCRNKMETASCRLRQNTSSPCIVKAAAFSKRHVASANSYNPENASMVKNCRVETTQEWTGNELQQTTIIHI
ncbi:MAG: hypothetical protein PHT47_00350 [Candidatus Cloacimonetes bacterium]|jgi:hypothetical protein|nr:hypothetical protein [Candidatus Cloacimonadota bacterium]MDD4099522.1 hypothetical protein [Candidatus Cloacimonadota bacterium]MDD4806466.1 hypothetical protein [Candidatus Cloacimonadota bacterium]